MRILHPRSSWPLRMPHHTPPTNQCTPSSNLRCTKRHLIRDCQPYNIHHLAISSNSECRPATSSTFSSTCRKQVNRQGTLDSTRFQCCANFNRKLCKSSSRTLSQLQNLVSIQPYHCNAVLHANRQEQACHMQQAVRHSSSVCFQTWKPDQRCFLGTRRRIVPTSTRSSSGDSVGQEAVRLQRKILFFGTDHFSLTCLRGLLKNKQADDGLIEKLDVVVPQSKYIKKIGRKNNWVISPVLEYANEKGLQVHPWPLDGEVKGYDLGIVASFGRLIPGRMIKSFPQGILNVHPSLLPRWRGAAPIIHTILNDDAETGVSIIRLKAKRFDMGPILLQRSMDVPQDCTVKSLANILANTGCEMLLEVLRDLPTYLKNERSQTEEGASYGGKILLEHAILDWSKPVAHIHRQYRAIGAIIPLHTKWRGQDMVLRNMAHPNQTRNLWTDNPDASPGQIHYDRNTNLLCIKCADGCVGFQHITIALRQTLSAKDFYNGYLSHINQSECFS